MFVFFVLSLFLLFTSLESLSTDIVVERVFVKLEQTDLPARKSGVVYSLSASEGAMVQVGEEVARLDDEQAHFDLQYAETELKVAKHKSQDESLLELAKKKLEKERQMLTQVEIENRASHQQANNRLKIEAAEKARDVAANELSRAQRARAEFEGAVSQSEIDGLELSRDRASLEAQQASFEQRQQELTADASDESVKVQKVAIEQSVLEVQQAKSAHYLSSLEAMLHEGKVASARVNLQHHRINSPLAGVVVELYRKVGEWVKPGDSVMRVLKLDHMKVEGFLPLSRVQDGLVGSAATIVLGGTADQDLELKGRIVFVSPEVDAVNKEVAVWAEFVNKDFLARPGMQGSMTIHLVDAEPQE